MKHLFLSLAALCVVALSGSAQCSPEDFDFMGTPFGISPDPQVGETFADGTLGQPYSETIHVVIPASLADVPGSPVTSDLDSVIIEDIVLVDEMGATLLVSDIGLTLSPNNNGVSSNPNAFLGGDQYCADLTGIPTMTGVFTAEITTTAWIAFFGIPQSVPFEFDGYTLTISEPSTGCTDDMACNYVEGAVEDDGSCFFVGDTCDDMNTNTENDAVTADCGCEGTCISDADGDGICDEEEVAGCTDPGACNYDAAATDDDGTCEGAEEYYDCDGNCLSDMDGDGVCDELEVPGCNSPYACNYDETATNDDGSCVLVGDACDDMNANTENDAINEACECEGQIPDLIASQDFIELEVYPNPVLDVLNVTLPQGAVHGLSLMSVSGQTVLSVQVSVGGSLAWDVSALPAGAYLLKVVSPNAWTIRKVMIGSR